MESVAAEEIAIAGGWNYFDDVDVDRRLNAERTCDHRPVAMHHCFLGGDASVAEQLADHRMILSELFKTRGGQPIRARVADVRNADELLIGFNERDGRDGCAHATQLRIVA